MAVQTMPHSECCYKVVCVLCLIYRQRFYIKELRGVSLKKIHGHAKQRIRTMVTHQEEGMNVSISITVVAYYYVL